MTQRNLTSVLLKVLGVVCLIKAIDFASITFSLLLSAIPDIPKAFVGEAALSFLPAITPFIASLVLGFVLIRYAEQYAGRLFPVDEAAFPSDAAPTDQWYVLAFTILGVFLLVWHVPIHLGQLLSDAIQAARNQGDRFAVTFNAQFWRAVIRVGLQIVAGLYLILGGRGLLALVRKLQRD